MKFYDLGEKKHVEIPDKDIEMRKTANGRTQAIGHLKNGKKLYKFVKA
jgi:hypothetical protein